MTFVLTVSRLNVNILVAFEAKPSQVSPGPYRSDLYECVRSFLLWASERRKSIIFFKSKPPLQAAAHDVARGSM